MKAAIYARVSTEDQEREGTSLQSQLEADLKKASELGYEVPEDRIILETYSGLTLDRPQLIKIRNWVRNKEVNAVISYSTDRLSRDPVHLLLLADEIEKAGAELILITEPLDNSMEGQLLGFVRGWASKLEAEKIKERTIRGRKERALAGKIPIGSHGKLYGYTYITGKGIGEGVRYVNEEETKWVREIYRWFVEEELSINAIVYRLRALDVPTPSGKGYWIKRTVQYILKNPAYLGKTYVFTQARAVPKRRLKEKPKWEKSSHIYKPREEWFEIAGATPPIISEEVFEAAQERFQRNKKLSLRNTKREYLLRGHVYCEWCKGSYGARVSKWQKGDKQGEWRHYYCLNSYKINSPIPCRNRRLDANYLERVVWEKVEDILSKPELVMIELQRKEREARESNLFERDWKAVNDRLAHKEKEKERIHKAFYITGDEERFKKDMAMLQKEIEALEDEKVSIEKRIERSKQFQIDIEGVKKACGLVKNNLDSLSFEDRRLALDALQIKVWIDGSNITIEGAIPIPDQSIVNSLSR